MLANWDIRLMNQVFFSQSYTKIHLLNPCSKITMFMFNQCLKTLNQRKAHCFAIETSSQKLFNPFAASWQITLFLHRFNVWRRWINVKRRWFASWLYVDSLSDCVKQSVLLMGISTKNFQDICRNLAIINKSALVQSRYFIYLDP